MSGYTFTGEEEGVRREKKQVWRKKKTDWEWNVLLKSVNRCLLNSHDSYLTRRSQADRLTKPNTTQMGF